MNNSDTKLSASAPVVIVGGGPVGMMLALNLSQFGVRSIIVNSETGPRWHPKGSTQNTRTMEHYRRHGFAEKIRTLGLSPDDPTDVGYFTRWTEWELARLSMPSEREKMETLRNATSADQIVEPILRCNQMYVENFVFEQLKKNPLIELRYGWRCVDWVESPKGVIAEIEDVASGRKQRLGALYLVGCDGGQSFVRHKLGIRYGGETSEKQAYLGGTMVSTYVRAPSLISAIPHRRCWQYWTINPEVRSNMVSLNGTDEFILNTQLDPDEKQPDDRRIAQKFLGSIGKAVEFEFLGHWTWTPGQALVAESYGAGRVLLSGDAIHLFTPTGGFGMNTGIDDAANLGWKLAAVVQGWGGPALLQSYEVERRPIAIRNTDLAKALTRNVGKVPVSDEMEDDTPAGAAARRRTGEVLQNFREEYASIGIQLGARYDGSPIVVDDGTSPPADDAYRYSPTACPGGRAPHMWLGDRTSLFDIFGVGFTLLRLTGDGETRTFEAAAAARGMPLKILDIDSDDARDLYGRDFALIRPDQHVAWRGNALPDDPVATIAQITGG